MNGKQNAYNTDPFPMVVRFVFHFPGTLAFAFHSQAETLREALDEFAQKYFRAPFKDFSQLWNSVCFRTVGHTKAGDTTVLTVIVCNSLGQPLTAFVIDQEKLEARLERVMR
jgi:hypothetical protein